MANSRLSCKQRHRLRGRRAGGRREPMKKDPAGHGRMLSSEKAFAALNFCRNRAARGSRRAAVTTMMLESYLYTGLRAVELLGLQIQDIPPWNKTDNEIRVTAVFAKGEVERVIYVNEKLKRKWGAFVARFHVIALERIGSKNEDRQYRGYKTPLFLNERGEPMEYRSVWRRFKTVAAGCGVDLWPHMCRHTYATWLCEKTGDLRMVQKQLGHKSPKTTTIYEHSANDRVVLHLENLDWG